MACACAGWFSSRCSIFRLDSAWPLPLAAAALAAWALLSGEARAQLTPETLVAGSVSDSGPYYQDLSDAIARLRGGDGDGAKALLTAARRKAPKLPPPEVMMATALSALNQPAMVHIELERGILQFPQDPEAYVRLAELCAGEGKPAEAELLFAKGIDVADKFNDNPKRKRAVLIRAYTTAAALDEAQEQWADAHDKLQALVKLDPDNAVAHHRLAKVLFMLKKYDDAMHELQVVDGMNNKQAMGAELTMAAFYNNSGDRVNAEKWINAAAKKSKENLSSQIGLATWFAENNDPKEALKYAESALKLDPQSAEAKTVRGNIARLQRDWKTAETTLGSAHLLSPTNAEIMNHLALVLIEKPDDVSRRRALEFAELNQRLNPNNAVAAGTLGYIQFRLGKMPEAERLLGLISTNNSQITSDVAYFIACVRNEQGRLNETEQLLEHVLSHDTACHYRPEAQELLREVKAKAPASGDKSKKPAERKAPPSDSKAPAEGKTPAESK